MFSAHRLRPGDIDVIGAFGDSITVSSNKNFTYLEIHLKNPKVNFVLA